MKKIMGLLFVVVVLTSLQGQASLLFYEGFNYAPGELDGQSGATGSGSWVANAARSQVVSQNLSYTGSGVSIEGGGTAVELNGTADESIYCQLDSSQSGDTYYVSFLANYAVGYDTSDFYQLFLDDDGTSTGGSHTDFGAGVRNGSTGSAGNDFFARLDGKDTMITDGQVAGETAFFVVRFEKSVSGAAKPFTDVALWVNPDADSLGTPDASRSVSASDVTSFDYVGVRTGSSVENTDQILIDEIRAGTEWNDVVVPEPAVIGMLGAGGILVCLLRRMRL